MAKIRIGDTVRVTGTLTQDMTAVGYLTRDSFLKRHQHHLRTEKDLDKAIVECFWVTKGGRPHREYFHEDALIVVKAAQLNGLLEDKHAKQNPVSVQ